MRARDAVGDEDQGCGSEMRTESSCCPFVR